MNDASDPLRAWPPLREDGAVASAPNILIVAPSPQAGTLIALAAATGLRPLGAVSPEEAPLRLGATGRLDALLIDLRGALRLATSPLLADLAAAIAQHGQARLLLLTDLAGLDDALAWFAPDGRTDWLCEPAPADLAGGLALLAHLARDDAGRARLREEGRDDGAARLEALSGEVRRLAEIIEQLSLRTTPTGGLAGMRDRRRDYGLPPLAEPDDGPLAEMRRGGSGPALTPQALHAVLRARRLRDRYFATDLFADPAWDIMLDLMAARLAGERVSVSSLCIAAAVPPTTALRWIRQLTERGVVRRVDDTQDGRRVFIELGDEAAEGMLRWWAAVNEKGKANLNGL